MPDLQVTVRLSGSLAERLGPRRVVGLTDGTCVGDLLDAIAREAGLDPGVTASLAVVAEGTIVPHDRALADGERIDVLVPAAGG